MKRCTVEGCERDSLSRGWCAMHYQRWKRHGDPGFYRTIQRRECSVEGCSNQHYGHGLCRHHHGRWKLHGDPLYVDPYDTVHPNRMDCPWYGTARWPGACPCLTEAQWQAFCAMKAAEAVRAAKKAEEAA